MDIDIDGNMRFIDRNYFTTNKKTCKTVICMTCGSDKFLVGVDDYYTSLKCPNCGWEQCVHSG